MSWDFPTGARYFENVVPAANTEKFWGFRLVANGTLALTVECHWGRIGTSGQSKPFEFPNVAAAQAFVEKKVTEKLRGGYVEKDRAWVQRIWPQWRPPFAIDALESAQQERKRREEDIYNNIRPRVVPTCEHQWEQVTEVGDGFRTWICVFCGDRRQSGRRPAEQRRRPSPPPPPPKVVVSVVRPKRRVIDFTED